MMARWIDDERFGDVFSLGNDDENELSVDCVAGCSFKPPESCVEKDAEAPGRVASLYSIINFSNRGRHWLCEASVSGVECCTVT